MADEKNEAPEPRLVQSVGGPSEEHAKLTEGFTESAQAKFWARPHDGRDGDSGEEPASREEQVQAFAEYAARPDIEDRQSILARENALPGQFSNANVASGSVDDGKVGTRDGLGAYEEGAQKEADSIKNVAAGDAPKVDVKVESPQGKDAAPNTNTNKS